MILFISVFFGSAALLLGYLGYLVAVRKRYDLITILLGLVSGSRRLSVRKV